MFYALFIDSLCTEGITAVVQLIEVKTLGLIVKCFLQEIHCGNEEVTIRTNTDVMMNNVWLYFLVIYGTIAPALLFNLDTDMAFECTMIW